MERRLVIKQILIMAGGLALLPSCLRESGQSTIVLKNLKVSLDQEQLLAELTESLIPKTNTPGAKDMNLHLFVLKMLDDCHDEKEQQQFMRGLGQFQSGVDKTYSTDFLRLNAAERQKSLLAVENDEKAPDALATFYRILKRRTIEGYLNSKYVMSNILKWELVPGRYNGFYPVKSA